MTDGWPPERLRDAVREVVHFVCSGDERLPVEVLLDGDDLLVTFHWPDEPQVLGIRFHPAESPEGPSTGETCESPEDWATEVSWVLMEELGTGLVRRGRRSVSDNGVVELHYRPDYTAAEENAVREDLQRRLDAWNRRDDTHARSPDGTPSVVRSQHENE